MNKILKLFVSILLVIPVANIMVSNSNSVVAKEDNKKIELVEVEKELQRNGVKQDDINKLMSKLENHIPWDNMNGSLPVKKEKYKDNDFIIDKQIFNDGSYIIKKIDLRNSSESTSPVPFSISGGNYSSGSGWYGYTGVKVSSYYGTFNYGFVADYFHYSNGYGHITNVYSPWYWGAGTVSYSSLYIGNSYGNPAYATYSLGWTSPGGWFSASLRTTLYVNGNSAWDTNG